jgi:hypothetical protein
LHLVSAFGTTERLLLNPEPQGPSLKPFPGRVELNLNTYLEAVVIELRSAEAPDLCVGRGLEQSIVLVEVRIPFRRTSALTRLATICPALDALLTSKIVPLFL